MRTSIKLRPVPKSIIGKRVGDHPDRRIYRERRVLGGKPWETTLDRAHSETVILEGDQWRR